MADITSPVLSAVGVAAAFISKLPEVDDDVLAFHNIVRYYRGRLEFFREERSFRINSLSSRTLSEIDSVLYEYQCACDQMTALLDHPLTRIKKKGRVNIGQRLKWVYSNRSLEKRLDHFHIISRFWLKHVSFLFQLPPSPNSENFSTMHSNEHNPDFIHSASKPPCPTIRPKSLPPQMGEISDEESSSRRPMSSVEYGSAGLGYGVVDRPRSAGAPTTISSKLEDHILDNECNTGLFLARREIGLTRRRGLKLV